MRQPKPRLKKVHYHAFHENKVHVILQIQGNLMLASLIQVIMGCTGIMGLLLKYIGPLTIAPTISLIGLSLTAVAADFNRTHWGIAIL